MEPVQPEEQPVAVVKKRKKWPIIVAWLCRCFCHSFFYCYFFLRCSVLKKLKFQRLWKDEAEAIVYT